MEIFVDSTKHFSGCMCRTQVIEWHGRFKRGERIVENHFRSGRLSSSRNDENIQKIHQKMNKDCRFMTDEISTKLSKLFDQSHYR